MHEKKLSGKISSFTDSLKVLLGSSRADDRVFTEIIRFDSLNPQIAEHFRRGLHRVRARANDEALARSHVSRGKHAGS